MKVIKELNKWSYISCSWIRRLKTTANFPQLNINRFNSNPIKISVSYYVAIKKLILKFIWQNEKPKMANRGLKEESKVGRLMLPDSRAYWKATVVPSEIVVLAKEQADR